MMDLIEAFATVIVASAFLCVVCVGPLYIYYRYNVWVSPCTRVYDGDTLIYKGNSYYYNTQSRGTATMFQEHQQRFLFPRMIKEVVSNDIYIETVSCSE